jgi:acetyltransferase-like isoleucine patch superfamily enzyme
MDEAAGRTDETAGRMDAAADDVDETRRGADESETARRDHRRYLLRYWPLAMRAVWRFRVLARHIRTRGPVFVSETAEVTCRRGLGHMDLGRWVWIGDRDAIRCHEGSVRIGDRVVFGRGVTVDAYLDVEIGDDCLLADSVLVTDFDHRYDDPATPIRTQGIVKSRVRIEADCWIGAKATVLRGSTIGRGSVIGALSVVKGDIPPYSVAVGNPARVVKRRGITAQT